MTPVTHMGIVCHYLSTVLLPALNGNKGRLFLNDQGFFLLVPEVLVFHFADLLDAVVVCHQLLGSFQVLGDVLGSVGVIVPTDGPDHSDLKPYKYLVKKNIWSEKK